MAAAAGASDGSVVSSADSVASEGTVAQLKGLESYFKDKGISLTDSQKKSIYNLIVLRELFNVIFSKLSDSSVDALMNIPGATYADKEAILGFFKKANDELQEALLRGTFSGPLRDMKSAIDQLLNPKLSFNERGSFDKFLSGMTESYTKLLREQLLGLPDEVKVLIYYELFKIFIENGLVNTIDIANIMKVFSDVMSAKTGPIKDGDFHVTFGQLAKVLRGAVPAVAGAPWGIGGYVANGLIQVAAFIDGGKCDTSQLEGLRKLLSDPNITRNVAAYVESVAGGDGSTVGTLTRQGTDMFPFGPASQSQTDQVDLEPYDSDDEEEEDDEEEGGRASMITDRMKDESALAGSKRGRKDPKKPEEGGSAPMITDGMKDVSAIAASKRGRKDPEKPVEGGRAGMASAEDGSAGMPSAEDGSAGQPIALAGSKRGREEPVPSEDPEKPEKDDVPPLGKKSRGGGKRRSKKRSVKKIYRKSRSNKKRKSKKTRKSKKDRK